MRLNSRATTAFCWLPPDSVPGVHRRRRRPDVELGDGLPGARVDGGVVAQDAACVRRFVVLGQDEVVLERETEYQSEPLAVARHERHAGPLEVARPRSGHLAAAKLDGAAHRLAQSGQGLDQLVLAVAGDAGDAEDLARPDVEADPLDGLVSAIVRDMQIGDDESRIGRVRFAAVDDELHVSTDHQGREVVLVGLRRHPRAHHLAPSDDGDPVGDLEHLVQLVADEDDRVALGGKASEDFEDLLCLLRCQDGGRLVEDEDPRLPVERLEDLDPLLPADRQRSDLHLGVDVEPEPLAELDDPAIGLVPIEEDRIGHRLLAEEDVVGDRQHRAPA